MKRFVMLGERNNKGQIVKNEQYTIEEFVKNISIDRMRIHTNISLFDRIFKWTEFKERMENSIEFNQGLFEARINELIERDEFGRKK